MRVFVAGASGVIGRRLVPLLAEAGHEVTGTTRHRERAEAIGAMGAEAILCDVFDAPALAKAVVAVRPEVVVHELTDIPASIDSRHYAQVMAGNDRIRTEGTRNLVAAARAAGARRLVAQSIAFAYAPVGGPVKDEDDPLHVDAPDPLGPSMRAVADLERQALQADGIEGVVLRYGLFYGPGTGYAPDGGVAERVRRHRFPVVGSGSGVYSFVHVDDAASATVAAVERGVPGVYNVVDDEPAEISEWLPAFAEALGAKPPGSTPLWLARLAGGGRMVLLMERLRGASNAKARAELGWEPRYRSWREGFRETLGS
jgi:nucleoside-diphosphate-sugar epimerase